MPATYLVFTLGSPAFRLKRTLAIIPLSSRLRGWQWKTDTPRIMASRTIGSAKSIMRSTFPSTGTVTVSGHSGWSAAEHQQIPYKPKPYEVDMSNPFYRYDPDQCILCGRCVQACQTLQVNETLSINWEDPHPRVLWDCYASQLTAGNRPEPMSVRLPGASRHERSDQPGSPSPLRITKSFSRGGRAGS
jgi:hypothetical protein